MHQKIYNILIIDDNNDFTEILSAYLAPEKNMSIIGVAKNSKVGIDMIEQKEPDIVLLDIIMPCMSGLKVLEKIQLMQLKKKPVIIMLSAAGQDHLVKQALSLGADLFIVKPFDMDNLISIINNLVIA